MDTDQFQMRNILTGIDKSVDDGLTLSRALSTRSDVFLKLNDPFNGFNDLKLAVKHGLRVKKNPEYHAKMAKLYACKSRMHLKTIKYLKILLVENNVDRCLDSLNTFNQTVGHNRQLRNDLLTEIKKIKKIVKRPENRKKELVHKPVHSDEVSLGLTLAWTPEAGKHFVASKDFGAAETLIVEKAKCACLYPKSFGTHCYHCFARLVAPIGCTECASVAFCSVKCCEAADGYHKLECKYLDLLIGSGMSVLCHIALRIVLQSKTPEIALEEGRRLSEIFCTNSTMRSSEDYFKRCLMTTFLVRCLQKSGFFSSHNSEFVRPTGIEMDIAELILQYLQSLQFNAHEIHETVLKDLVNVSVARYNFIGLGVYEVGAMLNHECSPSVTRFFQSTNIVLTSIRPHKKGEIVAENYGPMFTKQTLKDRQRNLASRYWFNCTCQACREDWPLITKLNNKCRIRCPTDNCNGVFNHPKNPLKEVKCKTCNKKFTLEDSISLLRKAEELFNLGNAEMKVSF